MSDVLGEVTRDTWCWQVLLLKYSNDSIKVYFTCRAWYMQCLDIHGCIFDLLSIEILTSDCHNLYDMRNIGWGIASEALIDEHK